jgi:hypothetical protein
VSVNKINRNDVYVGNSIEFKCNVECAYPEDYTYKWIVNNTEGENIISSNQSFPIQDTFEYFCNDDNSFTIQCCVSNGFGNEKCGEMNLNCIRKLNIFETLIFNPFFQNFLKFLATTTSINIYSLFILLTSLH